LFCFLVGDKDPTKLHSAGASRRLSNSFYRPYYQYNNLYGLNHGIYNEQEVGFDKASFLFNKWINSL